jgi:hypothetical protein
VPPSLYFLKKVSIKATVLLDPGAAATLMGFASVAGSSVFVSVAGLAVLADLAGLTVFVAVAGLSVLCELA